MKLLLESRCSIGNPFNLKTIQIDVHVHAVLQIECQLFQCSEITQRGDFKIKVPGRELHKKNTSQKRMCLIRPSCVVDLGCIFNVIQQFVKHSSCDLVVRH